MDHHFVKYSQHVVKVYICPIHIILILPVYLTSAILYMTYRLLPNGNNYIFMSDTVVV